MHKSAKKNLPPQDCIDVFDLSQHRDSVCIQTLLLCRIIHQSWKDANVPKDYHAWQQSWRDLHPDWKYILWTDEMNRK